MRRPSLARKPAQYSTTAMGASTPDPLVHGLGRALTAMCMRAQTEASSRSSCPGKHLPAADPTWMQPWRSAAQRLRIKRKRLVDGEERQHQHEGSRDALCQLLQLGDHAQGCCTPPHQGVRWPLSGSSAIAGPFRSRLKNSHAFFLPVRGSI